MVAEIGLFSLIIALCFSLFLAVIPTMGLWQKKSAWAESAPYFVYGQFLFVAIAYLSLTLCFLQDDFSVIYVLTNSSLLLPWFYKVCAVWGGHEGSMLLWVAILSFWMMAVCRYSRGLPDKMYFRILIILGMLSVGFIFFILATSNPFLRQFQLLDTPGQDLNPLLQDLGFLFHPPVLYMGYVGFSVTFAFAMAALWVGQIETSWIKWVRPWTLASWCCLTLGITLGSWWAYRELGWGGFWFWDPVENASFMPWLVGTALIHSLIISEQRRQFLEWSLLLAITAFSLSLIGTFLVRSGVLTSVHAFASDPSRGLYILVFLLVVIGGALLLFALRASSFNKIQQNNSKPSIPQEGRIKGLSKENVLLFNNICLVVAMLTILLGTVYPLLIDGLGLGKLSVGAPYFNTVLVPLTIPILLMMSLGIHSDWQHGLLKKRLVHLLPLVVSSTLVLTISLKIWGGFIEIYTLFGLLLAVWIVLSTIKLIIRKFRQYGSMKQALWGMSIAHCGIAVVVIGVSISTGYGIQQDVKMLPGQYEKLSDYAIEFVKEEPIKGPNYHGTRSHFNIHHHHSTHSVYPEKRIYNIGKIAMTEAAIDVNPFRDLYIALGEPLGNKAWSVRIYFKPFVRWIWGGGFLILAGGILAMTAPRYSIQGA